MACTIDHLRVHLRIRVLKPFTDLRGVTHAEGDTGTIQELGYDLRTRELMVTWEIGGKRETMVFPFLAKDGPGNGRMREFFAEEADETPLPPYFKPGRPLWLQRPTPPPELKEASVDDRGLPRASIARVWAFAARRRFEEAHAEFRAIQSMSDLDIAEYFAKAAFNHADDPDRAVYQWLRDRSVNALYAWGSTATSGGEGAAMMPTINAVMDRFRELDAYNPASEE